MSSDLETSAYLLDGEWEFVRGHLPVARSETRAAVSAVIGALRSPDSIGMAPAPTLALLELWCRSESTREALCLLANTSPGRNLLEIAEHRALGAAVEAHAPNHYRLDVRRLSQNLYAIEAV